MTRKQESRQKKKRTKTHKKIQRPIFLAARKSPPGRPKSPQSPSFPGKTQTAPDITHRLILRHTANLSHPCTGPSNSQRFSFYSCLSAGPHSPKRLSSAVPWLRERVRVEVLTGEHVECVSVSSVCATRALCVRTRRIENQQTHC